MPELRREHLIAIGLASSLMAAAAGSGSAGNWWRAVDGIMGEEKQDVAVVRSVNVNISVLIKIEGQDNAAGGSNRGLYDNDEEEEAAKLQRVSRRKENSCAATPVVLDEEDATGGSLISNGHTLQQRGCPCHREENSYGSTCGLEAQTDVNMTDVCCFNETINEDIFYIKSPVIPVGKFSEKSPLKSPEYWRSARNTCPGAMWLFQHLCFWCKDDLDALYVSFNRRTDGQSPKRTLYADVNTVAILGNGGESILDLCRMEKVKWFPMPLCACPPLRMVRVNLHTRQRRELGYLRSWHRIDHKGHMWTEELEGEEKPKWVRKLEF